MKFPLSYFMLPTLQYWLMHLPGSTPDSQYSHVKPFTNLVLTIVLSLFFLISGSNLEAQVKTSAPSGGVIIDLPSDDTKVEADPCWDFFVLCIDACVDVFSGNNAALRRCKKFCNDVLDSCDSKE